MKVMAINSCSLIFCFDLIVLGTLYIRRRNQLLRENAKNEVGVDTTCLKCRNTHVTWAQSRDMGEGGEG